MKRRLVVILSVVGILLLLGALFAELVPHGPPQSKAEATLAGLNVLQQIAILEGEQGGVSSSASDESVI